MTTDETQKSIRYGLNTGDADTLTLDLNGHTYRYDALTINPAFLLLSDKTLTLRNGRLEADSGSLAAIATDASSTGSRIVIESDFTVAGNSVLLVGTSPSLELFWHHRHHRHLQHLHSGQRLHHQKKQHRHQGGRHGCSPTRPAYYHPQPGTLTVEGGLITGSTGIVMKSGHLVVKGGEISATGARKPYTHESSGYISAGDASCPRSLRLSPAGRLPPKFQAASCPAKRRRPWSATSRSRHRISRTSSL